MGMSLRGQAMSPPPIRRLLPRLCSPGPSTSPVRGHSSHCPRKRMGKGSGFPPKLAAGDRHWAEIKGEQVPPFATPACCGGELQGPGSSLLQVKTEGKKRGAE